MQALVSPISPNPRFTSLLQSQAWKLSGILMPRPRVNRRTTPLSLVELCRFTEQRVQLAIALHPSSMVIYLAGPLG